LFLRLSIPDVAIGAGIFGLAGALAPNLCACSLPEIYLPGFAIGIVTYLVAAPLLYRVFRLRPMHFPKCPHCGAPDGPWGIPATTQSKCEQLICGHCGAETTFWYNNPVSSEVGSGSSYVLRWPRPLGIWKRLS
jgi:hypothetical protein